MDFLRQRFHTQHIMGTPLGAPEDVVRLLGAVQSQDYAGAKWSIGQRVGKCTDAMVDEAFNSGRFIRTHILRPTWHFVMPEDIRWMLQLTGPRVLALNAYMHPRLELDEKLFGRAHGIFTKALEGGRHLTRTELAEALQASGIVASGQRLAYIVMQAELTGLICSGALRGKHHTYALLEERVPPATTVTREEALANLVLRFFTGHAPATLKHFVWWSGLTMADARAGFAMIRQQLPFETTADGSGWLGESTPPKQKKSPVAFLIPEYDEALTGYRDMGVPDMGWTIEKQAWNDTFFRPIVIDSMRAGTWKRTITKRTVQLEANLFTTLDPAQQKALDVAAERYGRFLEMPVSLV